MRVPPCAMLVTDRNAPTASNLTRQGAAELNEVDDLSPFTARFDVVMASIDWELNPRRNRGRDAGHGHYRTPLLRALRFPEGIASHGNAGDRGTAGGLPAGPRQRRLPGL